jgi:hypothetical protein
MVASDIPAVATILAADMYLLLTWNCWVVERIGTDATGHCRRGLRRREHWRSRARAVLRE